jgi:hypothetical protein
MPSGNGVAAQALIALGHLVGEPRYVAAAERTLARFAAAIADGPGGFPSLLVASGDVERPPTQVLLVGDTEACGRWQRALERAYRPWVRVFNLAGDSPVPAALAKGALPESGARAWICRETQCLPPVDSLDALLAALAA